METKKLDRLITKLLNPNYTFKNIKGAPFKISDKVLVLDNPNNDNSFNNEFVGKKGTSFTLNMIVVVVKLFLQTPNWCKVY